MSTIPNWNNDQNFSKRQIVNNYSKPSFSQQMDVNLLEIQFKFKLVFKTTKYHFGVPKKMISDYQPILLSIFPRAPF